MPVYESPVLVQWSKTRQSVLRGDRSPLNTHQLVLPLRTRQRRTATTDTPPNMSLNGDVEGSAGHLGSNHSLHEVETPQWDLFQNISDHFSRNLEAELTRMTAALLEEETDFEDFLIDIEDMEQELQGLEKSWKSLMTLEDIKPEEWSGTGDKIRTNRKNIAKMKRKIKKN